MAWRTYKIPKKYFRPFHGWLGDRVWVTLPPNKIYPENYGFEVNASMVYKNHLRMADDYDIDMCIEPELREKGVRYKHYKMHGRELYDELLKKYEMNEDE